MFKEIRRHEKVLSKDELLAIMKNCEYGVLSTIGENGFPYGVPVNYVFEDNCIYFHSAMDGHKIENINSNQKVSFCVVCDVELMPGDFNTKFKSVISFGNINKVSEEKKQDIFVKIIEKFSGAFIPEGHDYIKKAGPKADVYKIEVEHITAKGKK